jgi:YcaO-like protein with predicted kinase domain
MLARRMALRFDDRVLDARATLRDGTHRAASLDATWRRFAPLAKRAGITRIAELTGLDTIGIPVYAAIRPLGLSLSTQQGKGLTPQAARVSALMEALETWSAERVAGPDGARGDRGRTIVRGSFARLRDRAVDVRRLARPRGRFDPHATLRWVEGRDLATDTPVLVPLDSVTLDTTFTRPPRFDISSNGLASGNVLVEAIVHGLYEVIERDAEAAWRRSGADRRIVLDTIDDPACRALIERIAAAGARVFVWDLASDTGIAVIGCAIMEDPREPAWRTLGFYQGFGAHLLPEVALARAITEAAQTRLTYIAGGRDDFFPFDYARATDPEILDEIWQRMAAPCDEPVEFGELPRIDAHSLGHGLEVLVERVRGQVAVVDLTHPALGVPVVKVIVPGRATDVEAMG